MWEVGGYLGRCDVEDDGGMRCKEGRREFGVSPGQVHLARCYGGREMRILTFSGRRGWGQEEHVVESGQ